MYRLLGSPTASTPRPRLPVTLLVLWVLGSAVALGGCSSSDPSPLLLAAPVLAEPVPDTGAWSQISSEQSLGVSGGTQQDHLAGLELFSVMGESVAAGAQSSHGTLLIIHGFNLPVPVATAVPMAVAAGPQP
jgi:hypothetical protein